MFRSKISKNENPEHFSQDEEDCYELETPPFSFFDIDSLLGTLPPPLKQMVYDYYNNNADRFYRLRELIDVCEVKVNDDFSILCSRKRFNNANRSNKLRLRDNFTESDFISHLVRTLFVRLQEGKSLNSVVVKKIVDDLRIWYVEKRHDINEVEYKINILHKLLEERGRKIDLEDFMKSFGNFPVVIRRLHGNYIERMMLAMISFAAFVYSGFLKNCLIIDKDNGKLNIIFDEFSDLRKWNPNSPLCEKMIKILLTFYKDIHSYGQFYLAYTYLVMDKRWQSALGISAEQSYRDRISRMTFIAMFLIKEYLLNSSLVMRCINIFLDYIPAVAEMDIVLRRGINKNNFASNFLFASSLLSLGLLQYHELKSTDPEFDWTKAIASLALVPLATVPRLLIGAQNAARTTQEPSVYRDSLGFTRKFYEPSHRLHTSFIPLAVAFIGFLSGDPLLTIAASFLFYVVKAFSMRDDNLTWTPRQFRMPPKILQALYPDAVQVQQKRRVQ